jgi:hypothetical protein
VQFHPAFADRIFKTLFRPCSETVERDRKACNAHFRHIELPFISTIYLIAGNVSEMGQFLPRHLTERAATLPHKAAASTVRHRGSYGPLSAARTRSKSSKPFRRRTIVKAVTDLPIEA